MAVTVTAAEVSNLDGAKKKRGTALSKSLWCDPRPTATKKQQESAIQLWHVQEKEMLPNQSATHTTS